MYRTLIVIGLAFILQGCVSTQSVSWPTGTSEGTIDLPENASSIALLSRAKFAYKLPQPNETRIYPNQDEALVGALTGFYNEVYNRHYLTFKGTSYQYQELAMDAYLPRLTQSELQTVAKGAEVLISLDMMHQFYEDQYTIEIRKIKESSNTYREVDYVVGKRSMKVTIGWRAYDVKTGAVIDSFVSVEDYFYESEDLERQRATELLDANLTKELNNIGRRLGHSYAARVSPTKHFTYRSVYDRGSNELEQAAAKVRDNKWKEASEIWLSALDKESNAKRKAMLYHNLAIYEERAGNMTKAKEYASLAANHHKIGQQTQRVIGF